MGEERARAADAAPFERRLPNGKTVGELFFAGAGFGLFYGVLTTLSALLRDRPDRWWNLVTGLMASVFAGLLAGVWWLGARWWQRRRARSVD